jgi:hypothetical protein
MTSTQTADLAADGALAHESLAAARLLLATDRVGDEAGHTVECYLAEAQESARRLYGALLAALASARGIRPASVETEPDASAADGERRRLLYLLEQAREVANRIGDEGGLNHARRVSEIAHRVQIEINEPTGG